MVNFCLYYDKMFRKSQGSNFTVCSFGLPRLISSLINLLWMLSHQFWLVYRCLPFIQSPILCISPIFLFPLQHHCRACGQVFCGHCSSKSSTLPKFGIEKEVRVCEACYETLNKWVSITCMHAVFFCLCVSVF